MDDKKANRDMKIFCFFIIITIILFLTSIFPQDTPVDGDIIFTQDGSDDDDVIEFITLKLLDLTSLKVTDNGIKSNGTLRSTEGTFDLSNTSWSNVPGGTFIRLGSNLANDNDATDRILAYDGTGSGELPSLIPSGDQIIAYLGTESAPTFIAGTNWANTGWITNGQPSTNSSYAPGTLSDTDLGILNNYYFDASVDGDATTTRNSIKNASNWNGSNSRLGYQDLTGSIGNTSLPVEFTSFSAVIVNSGIKLNWRTETEVNNYGFEILRQNQNDSWSLLGFVDGHGNTNSPKEYSFIDDNVLSGKYSYRLKQIDNDGTFEYSKVIEIDVDAPVGYRLSQNYPNPFNPTTTINFNLPESEVVKIVVYDILGTAVKTLVDEFKEAGIHTINFNASEFASGTYIYRIETSNYIDIKKMLLIK